MFIARAPRARNYSRRLVQSFPMFALLLGMALIVPAGTGYSAQVSLAWDANTEPNLAGYKIYYGTASHDYDWVLDVGKVTTSTVTGLTDGLTYYFAATAYNTANLESAPSGEVSTSTCTYSISPPTPELYRFSRNGHRNRDHSINVPLDRRQRCFLDDHHFGEQWHRKWDGTLFYIRQYQSILQNSQLHHGGKDFHRHPGGNFRFNVHHHRLRRNRWINLPIGGGLRQLWHQQDLYDYTEFGLPRGKRTGRWNIGGSRDHLHLQQRDG